MYMWYMIQLYMYMYVAPPHMFLMSQKFVFAISTFVCYVHVPVQYTPLLTSTVKYTVLYIRVCMYKWQIHVTYVLPGYR